MYRICCAPSATATARTHRTDDLADRPALAAAPRRRAARPTKPSCREKISCSLRAVYANRTKIPPYSHTRRRHVDDDIHDGTGRHVTCCNSSRSVSRNARPKRRSGSRWLPSAHSFHDRMKTMRRSSGTPAIRSKARRSWRRNNSGFDLCRTRPARPLRGVLSQLGMTHGWRFCSGGSPICSRISSSYTSASHRWLGAASISITPTSASRSDGTTPPIRDTVARRCRSPRRNPIPSGSTAWTPRPPGTVPAAPPAGQALARGP